MYEIYTFDVFLTITSKEALLRKPFYDGPRDLDTNNFFAFLINDTGFKNLLITYGYDIDKLYYLVIEIKYNVWNIILSRGQLDWPFYFIIPLPAKFSQSLICNMDFVKVKISEIIKDWNFPSEVTKIAIGSASTSITYQDGSCATVCYSVETKSWICCPNSFCKLTEPCTKLLSKIDGYTKWMGAIGFTNDFNSAMYTIKYPQDCIVTDVNITSTDGKNTISFVVNNPLYESSIIPINIDCEIEIPAKNTISSKQPKKKIIKKNSVKKRNK